MVALLAVLGLSFCKDLVLELILVLLLFKLDIGFLSENIFKLFLGATTDLFSGSSSLLFFLRVLVRSLILVKAVLDALLSSVTLVLCDLLEIPLVS